MNVFYAVPDGPRDEQNRIPLRILGPDEAIPRNARRVLSPSTEDERAAISTAAHAAHAAEDAKIQREMFHRSPNDPWDHRPNE